MLNILLILVTFISYMVLSVWQYLHVFKSKSCPTYLFQLLSLLPISLNGWFLYTWIEITGGQNLEWANMVALTAWCMNLMILCWSILRPILNLTLISYLFACLALLIGLIFSGTQTHVVITKIHPHMLYHVLLSIFGISLFGLAGMQSGLLLLQLSQLKNTPSAILKQLLPPIEIMEKFLIDMLLLGWIILGSGLFFGLCALPTTQFIPYFLLPKTLFSLLGFTCIGIVISRKLFFGLSADRLAKLTLLSIGVLIFSYFKTI